MSILEAVILGIIQGFTEFLPISSSGHLVVAQRIFNVENQMLSFEVTVHLGSLVAVFAVYWKEIYGLVKKPFQNITYMLIAATIPAVIAGLLFKRQIEALFEGGFLLAFSFIITGLLLLYSDNIKNGRKRGQDIRLSDSLVIGCMQAVAIMPGISRSGSTLTAGLHQGLSRETAARFSFLLSIPTILGAAVLILKDVAASGEGVSFLPLLFGFLSAMLSGYLSIRFMLNIIKKYKLRYFGYYVFAMAGFILSDVFIMHRFF